MNHTDPFGPCFDRPRSQSAPTRNRALAIALAGSAGLLLGALPLAAQETKSEEVFELSPFVIDGSQDEGYRATSSLAGSRLKADLKDIGAAISVVTKDLMDDLGASDLNDILLYTTATEAAGLGGNFSGANVNPGSRSNSDDVVNNPGNAYRIRGLGAPDRTRGYFLTSIPFDSYNSSRVDISRGANSILFGLGSPAGVIDSGIYQANANKDRGEARFRVGSGSSDHLSYRTEVDYNKVLIDDKLGLRISGVEDNAKYRQDPAFSDSSRVYAALVAKPWKNGTLRVNHERGSIDSNNPDPVSPTENISGYLGGLAEFHDRVELFGTGNNLIPQGWDPNNLPFYYDTFARAAKLDRNYKYEGVNYAPLYRLPNQVVAADPAGSTYGNPFHAAGPNIYKNGVIVYNNGNSVYPDNAFIGQVTPQEAKDSKAYAANGGFPGFNPGANIATANLQGVRSIGDIDKSFHYPTVTDLELFDFTRHLLAGTAGRQAKEFDATTASWEQTFLENNVGFELAFYNESYENSNSNPFRSAKGQITVDIQKTLPTGEINPNFGRPYVIDRIAINQQYDDRKSMRFTAFGKYDFEEKMFSDSFLGKILGQHTLTGLYAKDEADSLRYNINENWVSNDAAVQDVLNSTMGVKPFQRQVAYMIYMGDSVDLLSNPAGLKISDFSIDPSSINLQRIPDTGGTELMRMYENGVLETYELTRAPYIRGGSLSNIIVDSRALVLQSRWLADSLITTYGYREDTRNELKNTPPPLDPNDPNNEGLTNGTGNATIDPQHFNLFVDAYGDPIVPNIQEAETTSLSVVARLPRGWREKLLGNNDISLFFSKSENTSAGAIRLDPRYNPIGQPSGETEEIGLNASFLEGKINIRLNKFESTIVDANSRNPMNKLIADVGLKSIQTAMAAYTDIGADFAALDDDPESNTFGQPLYPNYDKVPQYVNTIAGLFGAHVDFDTKQSTLDESHPFAKTWKAAQAGWIVANDPVTGKPEFNGAGWFHASPPSLADTQDIVSEGFEAEIVVNPTKNWRIMLNAARTQTKTSNSLPLTKEMIDLWEPILYGNRATGELSFVGGLRRDTPLPITDNVLWNLVSSQWQTGVVDDYNRTKALDGQKNPEEREWRVNFITNYSFREGRLKGFSFGGSVRWQDEVAIGYPLLEVLGERIPDVANPYMGPSEINVGLRFGYQRKIFDRYNWNVSLNLNNITSDQDELIPVGAQPDGVIAVVRTPAPRTFSLMNSIKF